MDYRRTGTPCERHLPQQTASRCTAPIIEIITHKVTIIAWSYSDNGGLRAAKSGETQMAGVAGPYVNLKS